VTPASALIIELWPIERPKPYARNARKITDKAVDKVAASIREFGFRQPIVVDRDGVIIAGHTRLLAARRLGLEAVPVHVASSLSPAQVKAYRLADNRTNEEASWDLTLLGAELGDLKGFQFDLTLTGFDPTELDRKEPAEQPRDPDGKFSTKKVAGDQPLQTEAPPAHAIGIEYPEATIALDAGAIARWIDGAECVPIDAALAVLRSQFPQDLLGGCRLRLTIEPLT